MEACTFSVIAQTCLVLALMHKILNYLSLPLNAWPFSCDHVLMKLMALWLGIAWPRLGWLRVARPGSVSHPCQAWPGLDWPGLVSPGLAWPGLAWDGQAMLPGRACWSCKASPGLAWSSLAWQLVWPGLALPSYVGPCLGWHRVALLSRLA